MNIFHKRPLALVLCIGLCGFFLFAFDNIKLRVVLLCLAFLPIFISLICRFDKYKKTLSKVISLILLVSYLCSFLYFEKWFKAYEIYNDEVQVVGTVEGISDTNSYTRRLLVRVEELNGERKFGYKFFAYTSKSEVNNIITGTKIRFNATLTGFSEDSLSYNISKGINAYASDTNNIEILEHTDGGLRGRLAYFKEYAARYAIILSDAQSGGILSALLIGEREYLPDQVRLDFKRIGISHILALSGLHLAILSAFIERLLSFMKVKRKSRLIFTSLFIVFYMALTGFSSSVVRAGIMVILSCVMFLLSRSKDSVTSLALAVFIICLFKPHAIYDISLQLSALSTFGIIAFAELSTKEKLAKNQGRIVKYLVSGILTSVFAISSTLWITTSSFGGFSLLGPIATLIFSPIVWLIMNLGSILLLIGWLVPVGKLVAPLCRLITVLSAKLSSIEWAYVSSNYKIVTILIIFYTVCFFMFIILNTKRKRRALCFLLAVFCMINITPVALTVAGSQSSAVVYSSDNKCDEIILKSNDRICLINSAQYSRSLAYDSLELLEEMKITYIHQYYLTHYSFSIDEDLDILLSNVIVEQVYLPTPRNEDEETILKIILKKVEKYRTSVITFNENDAVNCGEYSINLLYSSPYGETSINAFYITHGERIYTYLSSGTLALGKKFNFNEIISRSDCLILGKHGKRYKEEIKLSDYEINSNIIVVNSDNIKTNDLVNQDNVSKIEIFDHPSEIVYVYK